MQRQSLGSPSSKLVRDGHLNISQFPPSPSSSSSSSNSTINNGAIISPEMEELKKKLRPHSTNNTAERYIHIIPMLTLVCFLILYLVSHDPSQNDVAQFNNFKTSTHPSDSVEELVDVRKGDMLGIRSLQNLNQDITDVPKSRRLHRKFAHF